MARSHVAHLLCVPAATPGVTQWEAPEGFESQPEAAATGTAGSVWQELYDEASQASYYYNSETGETTWDRPAELDAAPADSGAPAAGAEQVCVRYCDACGMALLDSAGCQTRSRARVRLAQPPPRTALCSHPAPSSPTD